MNRRTILRSMARSKMQGVKHLNRPYHAQGDKDNYLASPFARHWRDALGLVKTKKKPGLLKQLFGRKAIA